MSRTCRRMDSELFLPTKHGITKLDSGFLESMLGNSLLGTIIQISKRFPLLNPFTHLLVPLKLIRLSS